MGEEINYKANFCRKYFGDKNITAKKERYCFDVLNKVDILLKDKDDNLLLYIESKAEILNETELRKTFAQIILTNKKQKQILNKVAIIYKDKNKDDVLQLIDCSDNSVMYNNDINWNAEKASNPSRDAINRINDRIKNKITEYRNEEIKIIYQKLFKTQNTKIDITQKNINVVYNYWKNNIEFKKSIENEQELINLFLIDILDGTRYKQKIKEIILGEEVETEKDLIREETKLSKYEIIKDKEKVRFIYDDSITYTIKDINRYYSFWNKYKRPPEQQEFFNILERSAMLYSDKYRRDTGGEYTPTCFVEKQNEILYKHYDINDFIVFDPCAGVGNLQNQFGKEFKQYCYLSTLEQMDVDTCKMKDFENAIKFDYLKDDKQPKFKYRGEWLDINDICKRENKKLMIIMNPPYRKKGIKLDSAIEFFNKVVKLSPDVIVYYCKTEFFLRDTIKYYINSNYKIISHIFSNAKDTFLISEWPVSQVIFDKENGSEIRQDKITADRYDYNKKTNKLNFVKSYTYDNSRPNLIKEIENKIKENNMGLILGQWTNDHYCLIISNRQELNRKIKTENLKYCLLLKGINSNTHPKYYEPSNLTYRGKIENISKELLTDCIMFSLFYKGNNFSNKENLKNYIMPFTAKELGCSKNDLNVLYSQHNDDLLSYSNEELFFDFREFLKQFEFSKEAKNLYLTALEIFKFYHRNSEYKNKDWNDSFYDITNAIMGKDVSTFKTLNKAKDKRITKVKTTKGTKGFGRNTIKYVVSSKDLPIFINFFNVRDILAQKINKQLVGQKLLLWERENIY